MPELEQPGVEHLHGAADVLRATLGKKGLSRGRIAVARCRAIAVALEELESDERVEEVLPAARVDAGGRAQFRAGHAARCELREDAEVHCRQQDFGSGEGEGGLKDRCRVNSRVVGRCTHCLGRITNCAALAIRLLRAVAPKISKLAAT